MRTPADIARGLRARGRALGVTRLARVTGLDRSGVEVACAVRPLGHVLQVSNGKGATFAQAAASALSEAAELTAAERPDPLSLRYASVAELRGRARFVPPDACGSAGELVAPELATETTRAGWVAGRSLRTGEEVLVLAQAVFCPPADGPQLGPSLVRWTTNGLAAHASRAGAVRHALLEVMERDALPDGWTAELVRRRKVGVTRQPARGASAAASRRDTGSVPGDSRLLARLTPALSEQRLELHLFDLTARSGLPLGAALLFDLDEGAIPLAAGYACRESLSGALLAAAHEAAQSRLTDIHGAREDVAPMDRADADALLDACRSARGRPLTERRARANLLDHLRGDAIAVDLGVWAGLHVVKVVAPALRVSPLL